MPGVTPDPRPRVLVTGFRAFPGVSVNPTERLMKEIAARSSKLRHLGTVKTHVFDVDYRGLPAALEALGKTVLPQVAIHFGLSQRARGFRLERIARRQASPEKPDNSGFRPNKEFFEGGEPVHSTLPLDDIFKALEAGGWAVDYSTDAGAYLCNYLFYLSRSHSCGSFFPQMSGFVHVPPVAGGELPTDSTLSFADLVEGALLIVETCCRAWHEREHSSRE